jgi:hypothetical protein
MPAAKISPIARLCNQNFAAGAKKVDFWLPFWLKPFWCRKTWMCWLKGKVPSIKKLFS